MKRWLIWIPLCLVLFLPLSTGCDTGTASSSSTLPDTLIVGIDTSFPPMGFLDESNRLVGVDLDLAAAVCDKLGMQLEVKPISWDAKALELSSGKINCIWNGLTATAEREREFTLSRPYMSNAQVIVVQKNDSIQLIEDLAHKRVAVQSDSSALSALKQHDIYAQISQGEPVEYSDYLTALKDLQLGRVDALVMDLVVADYYLPRANQPLRILEKPLTTEQFAIAFRKGDGELRDAVETALTELAQEGILLEISQKWFGPNYLFLI